ncbi:MAG: flippase-like domain-containing protein [Planctomycetes bacterium]|nr:flippase-like domain-containing protein [Planctomycetota bacterium]
MSHLRWAVGIVISAVALYVAFAGLDWPAVGEALRAANYLLLLLCPFLLLLLLLVRAQRWRMLFYPDRHVSLLSTFAALNIGYMTGNILPLQLGEVARAYVLGEAENIAKVRVLSTIAIERLLDTLTLLTIFAILLPLVDVPRIATLMAGLLLIGSLTCAALLGVAIRDRNRAERWLAPVTARLPARFQQTGQRWAGSMLDGLSSLSNPAVLLSVVGWTVISWLISAAILYVIMRAFDLDVPVIAAPFLLVTTTFGFFIPSSPGAIGVYDAISIRTLTEIFSVAQAPAASYAIVAHALYAIPPTVVGAYFFFRHQMSLRRIREWNAAEDSSTAEEEPPSSAGEIERSPVSGDPRS